MSKPKTPSPSGISRLLAAAGFERAEYKKNLVASSGFRAEQAGEAVWVRYDFLLRQSAGAGIEKLARYAKVIQLHGYDVVLIPSVPRLIVTVKTED